MHEYSYITIVDNVFAIWACLSRIALPTNSFQIICTSSTFDFCGNSMTIHQPRRSAKCKEYITITLAPNETKCTHSPLPKPKETMLFSSCSSVYCALVES